ncbi:MAG: lysylphosphatidylglycerol synthase transmembrane domain-containing protein [Candidatus Omnitrophota bacterium]
MKKILFPILRVAVSCLLIVILIYIMRDKYDLIINALKGTRVPLFALALLAFLTAITLASVRLKLIINAQDITISLKEGVSLTFIGYFFNNFLPTAIGGDVVKAYYLSKKTHLKMGAYTSIFVDRVMGLITMIFMAFLALSLAGNQSTDNVIRYSIYGITLISLAAIIFITNKNIAKKFFFLLFFLKPIEDKIKNIYNVVYKYKHHKALMLQSLAISFISQLLFFFSLGILALSIGERMPIMDLLLRSPLISAASLLPSINGLGLREGATVMFFGPLIGKENAFAVSILWLAILLIISVAGGIIYLLSPQFKVKIKDIK